MPYNFVALSLLQITTTGNFLMAGPENTADKGLKVGHEAPPAPPSLEHLHVSKVLMQSVGKNKVAS